MIPQATVTAYLGLGANEGDRETRIRAGLERLGRVPGVRVAAVSTLRETAPVGGPSGQGPYLNGAARIETSLPAIALLHVCKQLERDAGRDPDGPRHGPRPLDLDVLLYGDEHIDTRELRVPHPRLTERPFVLEPLAELGVDVDSLAPEPRPRVLATPEELAARSRRWLQGGCVTGLVPTMGALHEGHVSLLRAARRECDRVTATIFVNPLQFGPGEDYASYPRRFERDVEVLRREGADAVYAPRVEAVYPDGFCTRLEVGAEAEGMEGAFRPGHFAGVATVVAKLLAAAHPTFAYFGRKDAQQLAVIRRMVQDLDFPVGIRECAIVREPDGLALSSRNAYLSAEQRAAALSLSRGLRRACERFARGERDAARLREAAREVIAAEPLVELQYVEVRREGDLKLLPEGPVAAGRILVAAKVGATRLIDNVSLDDPS